MSFTKFASYEGAQVLDVKSSPTKVKTASLARLSDFHDYRTDDGYLYVRIRAQSSRVNKNHDGWPTAEMAGGSEAWEKISSQHRASEGGFTVEASGQEFGFPTFIGKPIFVDHHNSDPKRARGVIVDSKFNVLDQKTAAEGDDYWSDPDNMDPEHNPPSEIELLLEVDGKSFPKFAKAIISGELDGFSMGCDVEYSKCSHCGQKATNPDEYCSHIVSKGAEHEFTSATGERTSKRSYENCYGIKYFELSGVFDPADDTATTKEVRAAVQKEADAPFEQPDPMANKPDPAQVMQLARRLIVDNPGMQLAEAMGLAGQELSSRFNIAPDQVAGGDGANAPMHVQVKDTMPVPNELPLGGVGLTPRYQGSYLSRKVAEQQPDEPQAFKTKAPEDVDTMREEKICPLCGSDMDDVKCDVCGYEEPPEQLQNPDLSQAQETDELRGDQDEITIPADENVPPPADGEGQSYLKARNPQPTASVKSDMRWTPREITLITAASKPQGDEPDETVTSDQTTPVTSAFRTAQQMIADAAKRNQENNMKTAQGATPADESAKAKKQVDVTGVGGVDEASAEAAGKADARVDVEGKGGVIQDSNAEASKPDATENLGDRKEENAGFQDGGKVGDPTKTFPNTNEPGSAVTDKAVQAAQQGVQPVDAVGKADNRVNVEEEVSYANPNGVADQWTGTGGNGVTRQQDPVTKKVDPNIDQGKSSNFVSIAALKLADTEVELGLITKDQKYARLAELAQKNQSEIIAEHRALAKVKTAGLTRTASRGGATRLPAFNKIARDEQVAAQPINDDVLDSALYG